MTLKPVHINYPFTPYTFDDYAEDARTTAIYAGRGSVDGLIYAALGLTGEAGEIANQVKKIKRDDGGVLTDDRHQKILDELSDVVWYISAVADELGIDLSYVASYNAAKLRERAEKGTLQGDRRAE